MDARPDGTVRAQRDGRRGADLVSRHRLEAPADRQRGEREDRLEPCKALADAVALSRAEREIRADIEALDERIGPALRVERRGVLVPARVAVYDVLAQLDVVHRPAPDEPDWRVEAHRLEQGLARAAQPAGVRGLEARPAREHGGG